MKTVGVVFGGKSPEHDVSIMSAEAVVTNMDTSAYTPVLFPMDREGQLFRGEGGFEFLKRGDKSHIVPVPFDELKKMDVVFPVLHGPFGEDGTIQGMFEMMNIPYVGCGVESCSLNMHKGILRDIFAVKNVQQPEYQYFTRLDQETSLIKIRDQLRLPLFVKPCRGGSSIGISRVDTMDDLQAAVEEAFIYVIVEEGVDITEELEVAVLGRPGHLTIAGPGGLIAGDVFYSYNDKYVNSRTRFQIPAEDLPAETIEQIRKLAATAFKITNCFGLARVDFLFNRDTGYLAFNEINTMPGFTSISMYPKLMMTTGMSFSDLVSALLDLAFQRGR
jgi:D-alanine-D-alanine ligase